MSLLRDVPSERLDGAFVGTLSEMQDTCNHDDLLVETKIQNK